MIYTLAGCVTGERCVIERTEDSFLTRTAETCAANDWLVPRPPWEARVGGRPTVHLRSPPTSGGNSKIRRAGPCRMGGAPSATLSIGSRRPVLNPFTRVATEMCPARGILRVVGYEKAAGFECRRRP